MAAKTGVKKEIGMVDVGIRQLFELGVVVDYDVRVGDCILVEATRRIRGGWRFFVVSRVCESKVGLASELLQSFSSARSGSRVEFFFEVWRVVDDDMFYVMLANYPNYSSDGKLIADNCVCSLSSRPRVLYSVVVYMPDGETVLERYCTADMSQYAIWLKNVRLNGESRIFNTCKTEIMDKDSPYDVIDCEGGDVWAYIPLWLTKVVVNDTDV